MDQNVKKPLVSVIVPNYNHAPYLKQRLDTVFGQTYKNFEVIILDDCSTDNSKDVIEKYKDHPNLASIIYNKKNTGSPFQQWYKGIHIAKGELIWIAESDDFADLSFLDIMVAEICKYPNIAFGYCSITFVNSLGQIDNKRTEDFLPNSPLYGNIYDGTSFIKERMLFHNSVCNASAVVFDKSKALLLDPKYIQFKASGDRMFWTQLAEQGNVLKINEYLDFFRIHETNTTSKSMLNGETALEGFEILKYLWIHGFLSGRNGLKVYLKKLEEQMYNNTYSIETKKKVMRVWNPLHLNKFLIAILWKFAK